MPIREGRMYAELDTYPKPNEKFRVVLYGVDEEYLYSLMRNIKVLHAYAKDKKKQLQIEVYVGATEGLEKNKVRWGYVTFKPEGMSSTHILKHASSHNIDLIYVENSKLILELYKKAQPYQLVETKLQLENEIEAFLTGKNLAWNINDPVWNTTWLSKNIEENDITGEIRRLQNVGQTKLSYTPAQLDYVRALINKAVQIRFCEENILGLIQKKNYSERNYKGIDSFGYEDYYDYSYEINYHLGNFYFLISGTLDIIGRLLKDIYQISDKNVKPNIEHSKFQSSLRKFNSELADFYSEEEINAWMIWLKRKRNFVAHESEMSYSDVLKAKKTKISESEIESRVQSLRDWNSTRLLIGDDATNQNLNFAREVIRMREDHDVFTKEAMRISYFNYATSKNEIALFHPLIDIKGDYLNISKIINFTAKNLMGS